jgi:hypothetical protein
VTDLAFQHPFDLDDARQAERLASSLQHGAEAGVRDAARNVAEAERAYRMALSKRLLELRAEGMAATLAHDVAKGEQAIADLRYRRDVAAGMLDAAQQQAWRHVADRKALGRLVDWSRAKDMADVHGNASEPDGLPVIGGRRAA